MPIVFTNYIQLDWIIAAKPHYDHETVTAFFEESDFLIDR